jgi:hypothetical protein
MDAGLTRSWAYFWVLICGFVRHNWLLEPKEFTKFSYITDFKTNKWKRKKWSGVNAFTSLHKTGLKALMQKLYAG